MIRFLLNDRRVELERPAGELLLDSLRGPLGLVGVKQGCREGDCGACTVLVGEPEGEGVGYRAIPSCMMLLGQVQGLHVVSIEGLNHPSELTPVQCAVAEEGATQCGFCTPGVVVSLTSTLCSAPPATEAELLESVGGNICRCTGYMSFRRAARRLAARFEARPEGAAERIHGLVQAGVLPAHFTDSAAQLARVRADITAHEVGGADRIEHADYGIAGGTDVLVQRRTATSIATPYLFERPAGFQPIAIEGDQVVLAATTRFEELKRSLVYRAIDARAEAHLDLVASQIIRERATIGGNIANASPIADLVICLLAVEAELELRGPSGARRLPLEHFFLAYKRTALAPDEWIESARIPRARTLANFEKVSRRERLDIATVNTAASWRIEAGAFKDVRISAGGVGPVPLMLKSAAACLESAPVTIDSVRAALAAATAEVTPISDVRGSAEYKRLLLRQLVLAHFIEALPEHGFAELAL